ncbi:MAG: hydroxymethylglutaryl-CoA lyase [Phycisphaerae bacterium]|jgi:hydroxymethylglutaryl-CoA lyase|nr:hydroxymethylglutaryl-CoA lyase [Phycisphaerae bacterium]
MRSPIRITEVGPRDGLQNESGIVGVEAKVAFIDRLSEAGFPEIEVTSFVSPKWVPQLADASEVLGRIRRRPGTIYSALVPNERGLERALEARVDKVAVFTAASESFARKNINAGVAESIERFRPVAAAARAAGLPVRGYVSCAVACPFEGPIAPSRVAEVSHMLLDVGVDEIDLGDTIGVAVPGDMDKLLAAHSTVTSPERLTLHLHDTRGTALACAWRAIELGVRSFDASCGGLGGCPYAPGATGNGATEELVYACEGSGLSTGIDLQTLLDAGRIISAALGRALPSRLLKAGTLVPCGKLTVPTGAVAKE